METERMHATMRGASDIGRRRPHNEDTYLVDEALGLALVADGMGGHACGEVASRLAARTFLAALEAEREILGPPADGADEPSSEDIQAALERALLGACSAVFSEAERDPAKHGMGTTCTTAVAVRGLLLGVHVGDSRAYLIRDGSALQLTRDHTVLAQLVALGRLTAEQAAGSAYAGYRNALSRAVGVTPEVEVDTYGIDVLPDDIVLLASDGLTTYVEPEELAELAAQGHDDLPERLIAIANERGGHDNITVVVMHFASDSDADESARATVYGKVAALARVPMFSLLAPVQLLELAARATVEEAASGTVVVREGESGEALYAVLAGSALRTSSSGEVQELAPGDHFGEFTLLDTALRAATVTTSEPSRLMRLGREALAAYLERAPQVGVQLLWSLARFVTHRDGHEGEEPAPDGPPSGSA